MRAILQRVRSASVSVDGKVVGRCGRGYLLLVGAHKDDREVDALKLAVRICNLRVFNDDVGKMNLALKDLPSQPEPQILAVSNFTVYGNTVGQRRPSFVDAAPYEEGHRLFNLFVHHLRLLDLSVETGVFGADMQVELVNDGPVTLVLDTMPG